MKRILLYVLVLVMLAGLGFAYLLYNKDHRDTASEAPAYTLQAATLLQEYASDEAAANQKYLDKLLLVRGVVSSLSKAGDGTASLSLDTGDPMAEISCQLLPQEVAKLEGLKKGEAVAVKGICTGMLMDVVLVRSVIEDE